MKKIVVDISKESLPTFRNGEITMIFDSLAQAFAYINKNAYTNAYYVLFSEVEYVGYLSPISGTARTITFADFVDMGTSYELDIYSPINNYLIFKYICFSKGQIKERLRKLFPIVDGENESSIGVVKIRKYQRSLDVNGLVTTIASYIRISDL